MPKLGRAAALVANAYAANISAKAPRDDEARKRLEQLVSEPSIEHVVEVRHDRRVYRALHRGVRSEATGNLGSQHEEHGHRARRVEPPRGRGRPVAFYPLAIPEITLAVKAFYPPTLNGKSPNSESGARIFRVRPLGQPSRRRDAWTRTFFGRFAARSILSRVRACDLAGMTEKTTLGALIEIPSTRLVVIHDEWVGYNPHSPIAASYELRRTARGVFAGEGRLSTSLAGERVVDVTVPAAAGARFLDAIAKAPAVEGPYEPRREWTEDYPHVELALHVGVGEIGRSGGIALLFSQSQGDFQAPWGACVGGQLWTLPGEEIGQALAGLRGPLKRALLDRMMRDADRVEASPRGHAGKTKARTTQGGLDD